MRPGSSMHLFIFLSTISAACSVSFSTDENNQQDKMALLALKEGFIAGGFSSESSVLNSWNTSVHVCQWFGITCGKRHKRVTAIELFQQKLDGVVSPSIGNLTFLIKLNLTYNSLHGEIPREIGQLRRLRYLRLGENSFEGQIPIELSNCSNLLEVRLTKNNLTGRIPFQFGSLLKLTLFIADENNLEGEMPSFFRNLSSLRQLVIRHNNFHGEIGNSLQGLYKLTGLSLASNNFSGSISPLYNLSTLEVLEITENHFTGTLPQDLDIAFPSLAFFSITKNLFTGTIPSSVSNISELTVFQVSRNKFTGRVPDDLGKLKKLSVLHLGINNLGSTGEPNDLLFIDSLTNCTNLKWLILGVNRFNGPLPDSMANFTSKLEVIDIRTNYIVGRIPDRIGELSGLTVFDFGNNMFTGTIPNSIGSLGNVSLLYMDGNNLHGEIPSSIGNLTNLLQLYLQDNSLDGEVPVSLGKCRRMLIIDISGNLLQGNILADVFSQFRDLRKCNMSYNSFNGTFPSILGNLGVLNILDVSNNNFSGVIPAQLGASLEFLNMSGNSFQGNIPSSFDKFKGLKQLDRSRNVISGPIPKELFFMSGLEILNLSFNLLEGEVPFFENRTGVSIIGNVGLCGGNPELHLQPCLQPRTRKIISRKVVIAIIVSIIAFLSLVSIVFISLCIRKKRKTSNVDGLPKGHQQVTYLELFKATDGFADSKLIGSGSFGDVYQGVLDGDQSKSIAVKVLNLSNRGGAKSFTAECKLLGRIRHRNLLRIITSCSSLDHKGNDFKALVFDFMSNGSLDNWLHFSGRQQETRVLTFTTRLKIGIEVGYALDYLHNGCEPPIVHCDLKPSNILLDDDMVAHVGDFGLAKLLLSISGNFSGAESLSTSIRGSIGYIAPEYGMGAAISPQGDIYSYGVFLLELITGKRPTDDMFNNEMSLRSFTERATPDNVEEIVDQCLMNYIYDAIATRRSPQEIQVQCRAFLVSFIEVGILCSTESSKDRMEIQSAIKCLTSIKDKYDSIST